MFNEKSEETWDYNAKFDNDLVRHSKKTSKFNAMNKYILNDICVQHRKEGLPTNKKCQYSHDGYSYYKRYEVKEVLQVTN